MLWLRMADLSLRGCSAKNSFHSALYFLIKYINLLSAWMHNFKMHFACSPVLTENVRKYYNIISEHLGYVCTIHSYFFSTLWHPLLIALKLHKRLLTALKVVFCITEKRLLKHLPFDQCWWSYFRHFKWLKSQALNAKTTDRL